MKLVTERRGGLTEDRSPTNVGEVLSPSTSKKDQNEKFSLYERHGLREYWVVDPEGAWLCVYRLDSGGRFDSGELREQGRDYSPISSRVLDSFSVDLPICPYMPLGRGAKGSSVANVRNTTYADAVNAP